jgi:hypothetical protein
VGIEPAALLQRMAGTLRHDIAPSVGDEFARTQAFMASVIMTKLAGQLQHAATDAQAAAGEHVAVAGELRAALAQPSARLAAAIAALGDDGATARWNDVVATLYAERPALEPAVFDAALAVVRGALRARLDRALRYAR